ncbi:hypothetical protein AB0N81_22720 [Streptomyces sp. NPDC093510]|uniref:hypothetical protein n=1 Tax=Streptomyces sp. NPDC093510 TaxID=3155199 RepID=UPI003425B4D2
MTRQGRGSTGQGRRSALPAADYKAPALVHEGASGGLVVDFHGEDGRRGTFDVGKLPLPGWHPLLAEAFAMRTGPGGGLRTLSGAQNRWLPLRRWTDFLASLDPQPVVPAQLTRYHVNAFHTRTDSAAGTRQRDMAELQVLFGQEKIRDQIPMEARDAFARRLPGPRTNPEGGYSAGELDRLTAAAREDTARIVRRIRTGEELVRRQQDEPEGIPPQQQQLAQVLAEMAETGEVPPGTGIDQWRERRELAAHLFLTWSDLPPLMALLAIATERNGETLKELPARHRLLENRAVEVRLVKRRRGADRWFETVTWEIGTEGRELHTPGGLYLLLLELTARSRAFCGSPSALCVWRNGHRVHARGTRHEHYAPFEADLRAGGQLQLSTWAATRTKPVLADPPAPTERAKGQENALPSVEMPLQVTFNKIKTSVDARRTRQLGGHLPSSAKSNTAQVLYTPTVIPSGSTPDQLTGSGLAPGTAHDLAHGHLDTAWSACGDFQHHPETGKPCGDSFLLCFLCGNCLITQDHLPRLLALLDTLGRLRQRMSEEEWWKRYGLVWVAVRRDVLGKFTPAQVAQAQKEQVPDALLDLVEAPWETP